MPSEAVAETLKTIAADPRHLGGEIGFIAILHTWGQTLSHHPHIHCLVPGGGLSPDGHWVVAIANSRLVSMDDATVSFRWRDYRHGNAQKLMALEAAEFIRRFLLHSLPDGFHRIRHYGFLANGCRRARLEIIRSLLLVTARSTPIPADVGGPAQPSGRRPSFDPTQCPCCGGPLRITAILPGPRTNTRRAGHDSS
jgi:hypothetical protein